MESCDSMNKVTPVGNEIIRIFTDHVVEASNGIITRDVS